MTRAAIFDIDGTLVDSVDLHADAWVKALAHFGVTVDHAFMRHEIGKGGDQLLPQFLTTDELRSKEEEISAVRSDLFKRECMAQVRPFPAVPDLFRRLREAGITIVLASSATSDEVDAYAGIAGIEGLFDAKVTSDDVERSKPHGDIFAAALERLAPIPAADAVVIGDTAWDVIAAGKAGLSAVGILCGGVPERELRGAGAVALYRDPADLLARFETSPLAPPATAEHRLPAP